MYDGIEIHLSELMVIISSRLPSTEILKLNNANRPAPKARRKKLRYYNILWYPCSPPPPMLSFTPPPSRLVLLNLIQLLRPTSSFPPSTLQGFAFAGARTFAAVSSPAFSRCGSIPTHGHKMTTTKDSNVLDVDDPYIFLEEVESEESIAFAKLANEKCLAQLGDPSHTDTYKRVLAALESDDRQATLLHRFLS
jgi:hypothetical protein